MSFNLKRSSKWHLESDICDPTDSIKPDTAYKYNNNYISHRIIDSFLRISKWYIISLKPVLSDPRGQRLKPILEGGTSHEYAPLDKISSTPLPKNKISFPKTKMNWQHHFSNALLVASRNYPLFSNKVTLGGRSI